MGFSYEPIDTSIKLNGKDISEYHPGDVSKVINSLPEDEREFVKNMIKNKMPDAYEEMTGVELPENYAQHAGRPNISEVPFMGSENDGYPFLPGHSPFCDGKEYHNGMCKCKYDEWNHPGGEVDSFHTEMWPGGPCIDDFDM